MPTSAQSHARSHALLLLQKLLNLRDGASPLTLVLDTLEQSGRPVIREFMVRAKIAKSKIIFVSFATVKRPRDADVFIKARGKPLASLQAEIASHYGAPGASSQKTLLILDVLNPLLSSPSLTFISLPAFLSSLLPHPSVSLVGTYHVDVPLALSPSPTTHTHGYSYSEYEPHPLATLSHLATAVLRVSCLRHEVDRRRARDRSLVEPGFGLGEGREGVLVGLRGDGVGVGEGEGQEGKGEDRGGGLVLEMELRRRSGRAVVERFVLVPKQSPKLPAVSTAMPTSTPAKVYLLTDHPLFRKGDSNGGGGGGEVEGEGGEDGEMMETTFSLGLTEKQRRDREGVVLPYFDAQTDIGGGEGGRILYEMGREDDFDEEEDEI